MDNASLSKELSQVSEAAVDDIPEAVRDTPNVETQSLGSRQKWQVWRFVGLALMALAATLWLHFQSQPTEVNSTANPSPPNSAIAANSATFSPSGAASPAISPTTTPQVENVLGHLPYQEAPVESLKPITPDGSIKLREAAAKSFMAMMDAAHSEGVDLVPLSGFRSIKDQEYLFFKVKEERGQVATKRAEVSAPPGYSEHHTGYAIDLGDAKAANANLDPSFDTTLAFSWLQANAPYFSFEISFPKDNLQGVSYEPWHWRFVGDRHSLETFYKAESLSGKK